MKEKKKPMERLTVDDLNIDGEVAAKTSVIETFLPPKKEAGRILSGDVQDQVKELVQLLRNEAKVI
ncbi:hypothetical protein AM501_07885 [Aneurinibacillus migulanus]|nr:hypothetical protein AM501_07885 [Aneurinibacillus migulanus]